MKNEKITSFAALVEKSVGVGSLTSLTFHSPIGEEVLKIKGKIKKIGGESVVQFESSLTEGRVRQENVSVDELSGRIEGWFDVFRKADLADPCGSAAVMVSKKGAVTLIKKGNIGSGAGFDSGKNSAGPPDKNGGLTGKNGADSGFTGAIVPDGAVRLNGNDREKNHVLTGGENFLKYLGISDENGRVHDKRQSKFRQICRFAEYIIDAEKRLSPEGELYVCDLCCGKSYLSFAAYYVITEILHRKVKMTCVDLKKSVMDFCSGVAEKCGMAGMEFFAMNINDFEPERKVDMVVSLHACDIATDIVLDFAVRHGADVILSTPCCQHQLNNEMNCPSLDFIGRYSLFRQKLAAAATDSLRLLMLEAEGYKTNATELIDPEETPKNIMLTGLRRKNYDFASGEAEKKREEYRRCYSFMYGREPDGYAALREVIE